jgi:hypothetical protein
MCFSMEASFTASAVLLTAGSVALVKTQKQPTKYFAAIPLLFGIQQAIEGFQWLAEKPSMESTALGYGFLFFAFLLWPAYTPFATFMMEKDERRKKILKYFTVAGFLASLFLLVVCFISPLQVYTTDHHIVYDIPVPFTVAALTLYVSAVCTSLLSTRPRAKLLGFTTLAGFIVAILAYQYAFTSVWCFFAAILSVMVCVEIFHSSQSMKGK